MSRTLTRFPVERPPFVAISAAARRERIETATVALKPKVAAFGDDADRARWGAILAAECGVVHWYGTVAEALVDLRMRRFHAVFIPTDAAFARALVHTLGVLPVVVASREAQRVLASRGYAHELLRSRTDFTRAVRAAIGACAKT